MERGIAFELGSPSAARLLLVALLPTLLFAGHWQPSLSIPIPGTGYSLGAPAVQDHAAHAGDHAGHCHSESAGCSQSPASQQAPVADFREMATTIGLSALAILAVALSWRPTRSYEPVPEVRPPRVEDRALA